ncbi:hypothetical protein F5Y18DRAFT_401051 [Xylariaceae sp. FL1019]|nr:hypothetical protein F5Y18DRAFT_401051 [Xylariaceae sp. FL1019]
MLVVDASLMSMFIILMGFRCHIVAVICLKSTREPPGRGMRLLRWSSWAFCCRDHCDHNGICALRHSGEYLKSTREPDLLAAA